MPRASIARQRLEDETFAEFRRTMARGFGKVGRTVVVGPYGFSHHLALHPLLRGQAMTQREIALAFGVTPARITALLTELEGRGAVERKRNRTDRREVLVRVTPAGRALHTEFHRTMFRQLRGLFDGFSDLELRQLVGLLRRVAASEEDGPPRARGALDLPIGIAPFPPPRFRAGPGRPRRPRAPAP